MKALVIEDSRLAREGLVRMLAAYPQLEIVGAADHPEPALALIQEHRPEVLFLDIHMPGETGFSLLEKLDYSPKIIFTTAYSEHAIRSFDFNTIDYLLKPISRERLDIAIEKLQVNSPGSDGDNAPKNKLDISSKMLIKDGDKCFLVALQDIRYFESCKNYVRLFFGDTNAFVKKSMNAIESRLPTQDFLRANRQYIINLHQVRQLEEDVGDGYLVTMSDGKVIDISRRNAKHLKDLLSF